VAHLASYEADYERHALVSAGGAAEQGDEADEAKHIGASQLIPGVGRDHERGTVDDQVGVLVSAALLLSALQCGGPAPQVLYHNKLESLDGLLTRDGMTLEAQAWQGRAGIRIDVHGSTSIPLAEVQTRGAAAVVLTYRGHLRSANLTGRAYLEMRCTTCGDGELVSRALDAAVSGTTEWVMQVTRLSLGKEPRAQTVRLNVRVEGSGIVWVQNVLLAQAEE
jgi:hypothetical protein